jgi:hypothetical protein
MSALRQDPGHHRDAEIDVVERLLAGEADDARPSAVSEPSRWRSFWKRAGSAWSK